MAFEIADGQIFLHANQSDNSKAPAIKGDMRIDGVVYEVALWPAKSGKEGSYSGKVKVKGEKEAPKPKQTHQHTDDDQQIPF
jgi:hypothetical protein